MTEEPDNSVEDMMVVVAACKKLVEVADCAIAKFGFEDTCFEEFEEPLEKKRTVVDRRGRSVQQKAGAVGRTRHCLHCWLSEAGPFRTLELGGEFPYGDVGCSQV